MDEWYVIAMVFAMLICNCLILAWGTLLTVTLLLGGHSAKKAAARRQAIIDEQEIAQRERTLAGGIE